jgi:quinol monooxygenase YgiN
MKAMLITFEILPDKQAEFEAAVSFHVGNVRTRDPSYFLYSLTRDRDNDTRYILMQQFESWESQEAHQTYDYVLAAMPAMNACIAAPPTIDWLEVII